MRLVFANVENYLKTDLQRSCDNAQNMCSHAPISELSLSHSGMGMLLFYYYYLVTLISIGIREKCFLVCTRMCTCVYT